MIKKCVESDDMGYFHASPRGKKKKKKTSNDATCTCESHPHVEGNERNVFDRYLNKVVSETSDFKYDKKLADVQRGLLIGVQRLITSVERNACRI